MSQLQKGTEQLVVVVFVDVTMIVAGVLVLYVFVM
jgi:hypothetical protein